jgi:hypothetical protein
MSHHDLPDVDSARRAIDEASTRSLDSSHDRWVHGLACAGFGVLIGVNVGILRLARGTEYYTWISLGGLALLVALAFWQSRATRTWPRRARRTGWYGLGGSVLLAAIGHGCLNTVYRADPGPVPVLVLASAVVALPLLVAGHLIARGGPR